MAIRVVKDCQELSIGEEDGVDGIKIVAASHVMKLVRDGQTGGR